MMRHLQSLLDGGGQDIAQYSAAVDDPDHRGGYSAPVGSNGKHVFSELASAGLVTSGQPGASRSFAES
jgi:hypothetical protein